MSNETDLINLYSARILGLAADIPRTDRVVNPQASVKKRSPLCGSTVTIDLSLDHGVVSEYGQDVKACALGQAAASVVGGAIVGANTTEVRRARDELSAMLKSDGPAPHPPFDGLDVLRPAKDYKNRHASIMLALDAAVAAIDQIENTAKSSDGS
jgi:NifU-like protein involved in Fe-S cluster formation